MARKKGGGGKLNRSEVIQARLDPKIHMAAEILARSQRRTLSSLIEVLMDEAISKTKIAAASSDNLQTNVYLLGAKKRQKISIKDAVDLMWSYEEADRFAMLALLLPDLLTSDEELLWSHITGVPYFWAHFPINVEIRSGRVLEKQSWPLVNQQGLIKENLREYWPLLREILDGEKSIEDFKRVTKDLPVGQHIERPSDYPHDIKKVNTGYVD